MEITEKEYKYLVERDKLLARLEAAGVDNWEGYSEGCFEDDEDDEDDF